MVKLHKSQTNPGPPYFVQTSALKFVHGLEYFIQNLLNFWREGFLRVKLMLH